MMVATCLVSFVANAIGRHAFSGQPWLLSIPFSIFSTLLFSLGYCGFRQCFSFADLPREEQANAAAQASATATATTQTTPSSGREVLLRAERICHLMQEQQLYLKHDLKVADVALALGTNVRYVQQALNECMHVSFAAYINRLRIAHARQLMQQHPEISMNDVIQQSGYASVSTYYRNVRRYHTADQPKPCPRD